jgi:hypothetical protein
MNQVSEELNQLVTINLSNYKLPVDCGIIHLKLEKLWNELTEDEKKFLYYFDDINLIKGSFKYPNQDAEFYHKLILSYRNLSLLFELNDLSDKLMTVYENKNIEDTSH